MLACGGDVFRGLHFSFQPSSSKGNMTLRGEIVSHKIEPSNQLFETVVGKTHSVESFPVADIPNYSAIQFCVRFYLGLQVKGKKGLNFNFYYL